MQELAVVRKGNNAGARSLVGTLAGLRLVSLVAEYQII